MNSHEKLEMKLLRESLDRADHLASVQAQAIEALQSALRECQQHRETLQMLAADQQRALQGVGR